MVIVDEAHHARVHRVGNTETRTQLFRLVDELVARPEFTRRACLFLTATPLQLDRYELYSLAEMLDPILFSSADDFVRHIDSLSGLNRMAERLQTRQPANDEWFELMPDIARFLGLDLAQTANLVREVGVAEVVHLLRGRHRLSEIMIRNRKSVVQGFQPRRAFRWEVTPSSDERRIYDLMSGVLRRGFEYAEQTHQNAVGFLMVVFQKLLASSSRALLSSLKRRRARLEAQGGRIALVPFSEDDLDADVELESVIDNIASQIDRDIHEFDEIIRLLEGITIDTKAQVLLDQLGVLLDAENNAKVLIFTEFRETQDMLSGLLGKKWSVHNFHGSQTAEQKDAAVDAFRNGTGPQILVSTEAGGEGRNFQFCHHLVNYDLPWNPMKVEQRIGRVDRIGQEHPITIFNFHVEGTIEGRVLDVLERRIRVFEEAVGGLDPILGEAEDDIRKALRLAQAEGDAAIERLGRDLERRVAQARVAEQQLQDLILQDKSFSAEIAQMVMQTEAPVTHEEFERFLIKLLASANTFIGPRSTKGERRITFHAPFAIERADLIGGQDTRRVCFDPRLNTDSELVEYLGFGHPIVDALVKRVTEDHYEGAAAVRRVTDPALLPGWQFNWRIKVGGVRTREFLVPVFVDDHGIVDEEMGTTLLRMSRSFGSEASAASPVLGLLDVAFRAAQLVAIARRDSEIATIKLVTEERVLVEEARIRSLMEHRTLAARDRVDSCLGTLRRLRESGDARVRQAIPLWEANLARAEAEIRSIQDDQIAALADLNMRRNPSAEFSLLNVARIETVPAG